MLGFSDTVVKYIADFHLLSFESTRNENNLMDVFIFGFNESIKDNLSTHDYPWTLKHLEDLASPIDLRLKEFCKEQRALKSACP